MPMLDVSREDTQCLAATSKQKLYSLGDDSKMETNRWLLLIQLCIGLFLLEQHAGSWLEAVIECLVGREGQPRGTSNAPEKPEG